MERTLLNKDKFMHNYDLYAATASKAGNPFSISATKVGELATDAREDSQVVAAWSVFRSLADLSALTFESAAKLHVLHCCQTPLLPIAKANVDHQEETKTF